MRLLLTRPIAEAERTAAILRTRGHEILLAPMLAIEPAPHAVIGEGPWSAVIMTSGNAARALRQSDQRQRLVSLPLFAVGRQTAAAARLAGFTDVISADGDADALVRLLQARSIEGDRPLLYLAGNDHARDLAGDLAALGLRIDTVVVYRAVAAAELPPAIRDAFAVGTIEGVLHYSRRTAAIFIECMEKAGLEDRIGQIRHYCLSPRASEPIGVVDGADIRIASRPDEAALLDLIGRG